MQQGLIRNHAAVGTPLPHRYRVKKQILAHGPSIHHPLEPGLPTGHHVDLFKHQQIGLSAQVDKQLLLQVATHATNRLHCAKKPQLNIAIVAESRGSGPATRITNKIPGKTMPDRSIRISLDERLLTQLDAQGPSRSALVSEALTQVVAPATRRFPPHRLRRSGKTGGWRSECRRRRRHHDGA